MGTPEHHLFSGVPQGSLGARSILGLIPGNQLIRPAAQTYSLAAEGSVESDAAAAAAALPPVAQGASVTEWGGRLGGRPSGTWDRSAGAGTRTAGSCGKGEASWLERAAGPQLPAWHSTC